MKVLIAVLVETVVLALGNLVPVAHAFVAESFPLDFGGAAKTRSSRLAFSTFLANVDSILLRTTAPSVPGMRKISSTVMSSTEGLQGKDVPNLHYTVWHTPCSSSREVELVRITLTVPSMLNFGPPPTRLLQHTQETCWGEVYSNDLP